MTEGKIRVVIVDDEYLDRNLLRNCIDWNRLGMEISGEAEDAAQALGLIRRSAPDVIFTDIQMPGDDGIRLSETVLREHPETKIVVLTGFDTFDYAQRSIKAGVADYLLKPIDGDEVLKTASALREQIGKERRENEEYNSLRRQLSENLPYLRERFLGELLGGAAESGALKERMEVLGIRFRQETFQAAVFEPVPEDAPAGEEGDLLRSLRVLNCLRDRFRANENVFVLPNTTRRTAVLNNDESVDLYEECRLLRKKLAAGLSCPVCAGLGRLKRGAENIAASYREALEALRYRIAVGNNAVILYDSIRFPDRGEARGGGDLYGQLDFCLRTGLREKAAESIDALFEAVDLKSGTAVETVRLTALNAAQALFRAMTEAGLDPAEIYRSELLVNGRIFRLGTLPDAKDLLKDTAQKCMDAIGRDRSGRILSLVGDMKRYVRDHYADSGLTLTELAKKFFFNPSYLSRTFKKKAGVSFVEYLTEVRMEKAVELLKAGNAKAFEIAGAVGIPDPNYFSTCFKKHTGVSISEYRRSLTSGEAAASPGKEPPRGRVPAG